MSTVIKANKEIFPAFATLDECLFYALEEEQNNYNSMMKNIGLNELGFFVSYGSVIDQVLLKEDGEEGDKVDAAEAEKKEKANKIKDGVGNVGKNLKDLLDKAIGVIKGLVEKVLGKVKDLVDSSKEKLTDKAVGNLEAKLANLPDDYKFGKTYTYKGLESFANYNGYVDEEGKGVAVDSEIETIKNLMRGDEVEMTKDWVKANIDDIKKTAVNYNFFSNSVKKSYKDCINALKEKKAECEKKSDAYKDFQAAISSATKAMNCACSCHFEKFKACRKVILKLAVTSDKVKEEKKEVTGESYTFSSEIDSIFDWGF